MARRTPSILRLECSASSPTSAPTNVFSVCAHTHSTRNGMSRICPNCGSIRLTLRSSARSTRGCVLPLWRTISRRTTQEFRCRHRATYNVCATCQYSTSRHLHSGYSGCSGYWVLFVVSGTPHTLGATEVSGYCTHSRHAECNAQLKPTVISFRFPSCTSRFMMCAAYRGGLACRSAVCRRSHAIRPVRSAMTPLASRIAPTFIAAVCLPSAWYAAASPSHRAADPGSTLTAR